MRDAHLAQSCRGGLKLRFAHRPMTAQGLRPPRRIWKAASQHGKTGKIKASSLELLASSRKQSTVCGLTLLTPLLGFQRFPKPPEAVSQSAEGRPKAVRRERRHMKLASMWRRTRSNRAKRASAVFLLRRSSALPISRPPKFPDAAGRPPQRGNHPRNAVKVSRGACANSERKHSVYWDWSAADSRYALTLESNESNSSPSHFD